MKTTHSSLASRLHALAVVVVLAALIPRASAQLVADGQSKVLDGMSTNIVGGIVVGTNGPFTLLVLTNGAMLTNTGSSLIGDTASANYNQVVISGINTTWDTAGQFTVGKSGRKNHLTVRDGGLLRSAEGHVGVASVSNVVTITDSGSQWRTSILVIGGPFAAQDNQLIVSNGGFLGSDLAVIGMQGARNSAIVVGGGSFWSNSGDLFVGYSGSRSELVVSNGGTVTVVSNLVVGGSVSFIYEHVVRNDGGYIIATNSLGTGTFDVRHGAYSMNAGVTSVDHLVLRTNGMIAGNGIILGTVTNFGTLDVGISLGAIYVSEDFHFQSSSTAIFELSGTTPASSYDQLTVTNFVQFGGMLDLRLTNGFLPGPNDSFTLVKFASSFGIFQNAVNGQRMNFAGGKASFLVTYETNLVLSAVQYVDTDGDGQGDLQEQAAGTDPNNSASVLKVISITPNASGHQTVLFQSEPVRTYRIEYSTNMSHWTAALTNLPSAGATTQWTDDGSLTGSPPGTNRFYRVGLQ